ncbi:MAG: glycosyl hydrolase, partial [Deltaproteobacteria bacterium]|nr:glycosyl hydrolase [Deltaproteobacteria bacterium]
MTSKKFLTSFLLLLALLGFAYTETAHAAVGNTSPKKGTGSTYLATPENVRALGITWGYNWNLSGEDYFRQNNYEHVPMVHASDVPDYLQYIKSLAQAFPGRYWLVFNEPDYHAQENLTPAAAAVAYQELRKAIKGADSTAKLIVGGVLWPDPRWMTNFREEYKTRYGAYPVVEGWHVHHYVEPDRYNINEWRRVPLFWKDWMMSNGGMVELWLTEFGCLVSDSVNQKIMEDQIAWLESLPWLTRYGWFNYYLEPSYWMKGTLTLPDGQLSALGQLYATFGTPPSASTSFKINASAGNGGTINPSGNITIVEGGSKTFSISPNSGFRIADVKVDGVSVGAITSKAFANVNEDHTIDASFMASGTYTLTVSAGSGGTLSPSGVVTVNSGGSKACAVTPNSGYRIADVLVDGVSHGSVISYIFSN